MGVALWAAVKGYRCVFTMPDKMSSEKVNALTAFGAEVVVTPTNVAAEDPRSYYETAKRIHRETPGSFMLNQYHNPDNIEAHYRLTGPEIEDDPRKAGLALDAFVAGLGTGGTMSGAGKYLKEKFPQSRNVGVDPQGSVYLDYFKTGKLVQPHVYKVEGIGEDMLCKAMDFTVLDDVRRVDDKQSFQAARRLAREEGLFGGGSSGSAIHVAVDLAHEMGKGKNVVVILPDSGSRYITKFYSDEWMKDNGFLDPTDRMGTVSDLLGGKKRTVYTVKPSDTAKHAVELMKRHGVSQLPVVDGDKPVAMLHEVDLLQALLEGRHELGGRAPWRTAPCTFAYSSSVPARAERSSNPPRLMSPRPTKDGGKRSRSPKMPSSGSTYFAEAMLPSSTISAWAGSARSTRRAA